MKQRGRTSAIALVTSPIEAVPRLPPPDHLSQEEADEWLEIVNTMPAEHFARVNAGLLEQYCHHMIASRKLGREIAKLSYDNPSHREELMRLLNKRQSESYIIISLLRQMRLTQQSIFRGESVKHPTRTTKRPWEK